MRKALIVGLSGEQLATEERALLSEERPAGIILFSRNCLSSGQVRDLVGAALDAIGCNALVAVDQEGGRVQRLRPPGWRALPPAAAYGRLHAAAPAAALRSARVVAELMASDLRDVGINMNCAPVLDVPVAGAHAVIGDRAYAASPHVVAQLGRAVVDGFINGGVVPVVKHIPGHGRARADSHFELPVVDVPMGELDATDFVPFRALRDAPSAMTAHVVYPALDPARPASTSELVTRHIRNDFGFDGLLMSDDIGMRALTGSIGERAAAVIGAGSDVVLHCSGVIGEMREAAASVPVLVGKPAERFERCLAITRRAGMPDRDLAERAVADLMALRPARGPSGGDASSPVESV